MAKISDTAKEVITNELKQLHPNSAIIDKKLYINLNIEGEEVQIAVTLTAPKTKVNFNNDSNASGIALQLDQNHYEAAKAEVKDIFDFFNL